MPFLQPSGTIPTLSYRALIGFRQSVGCPQLAFLGDLRIDRRGLGVRVSKLFLHDLQVVSADSVQVGGVGLREWLV